MKRHLVAAARRRNARPLRFHNARGAYSCPGHRSRRAARAAEKAPGLGPVNICLISHKATWRILVPNHWTPSA